MTIEQLTRAQPAKIATSFPKRLNELADRFGWNVATLAVKGSVEGYVAEGAALAGFDLVESGITLKDNGLVLVDTFGSLTVAAVTELNAPPTSN